MIIMSLFSSCNNVSPEKEDNGFKYQIDQFADIRILKYEVPGFDQLSLEQKLLIFYLGEAALSGRDILWDQNFKYNLIVRKSLEGILSGNAGDRESEEFKDFITYSKRVFFSNGIHHHYSNDKFIPGFSKDYFISLMGETADTLLPLGGMSKESLIEKLLPVMFDETLYAKRSIQNAGVDIVAGSASNFYEGVTQMEVEQYYQNMGSPDDSRPLSYGLNSKVIKVNGKVEEQVYKSGGLYGKAIDRIVFWLEQASTVAENRTQKKELELLIEYYKTGDLKIWDEYNVTWAGNTNPVVDYVNGFIENYADPMGRKATWEAIVNFKDIEATKRTETIVGNAQWFEDNSPISDNYKKEKVTGVAAKVINIAMLGGDCYPASPLGINLPNADWIRNEVGSKSVTLANISKAYDQASLGSGFLEEFAFDKKEIDRAKKYVSLSDALHTDFHECIGHASGKLAEGTDPNALKNYSSALEEARADLFALYFLMDEKVIQLGLVESDEVAKAQYDNYMRNGLLTQMVRIKPGKDIEQAHMRCRALISRWVFEAGAKDNVIEMVKRDGKTFVKINDYYALREKFGMLLKEIQRIKSEGDFEAGKELVENYGVKIDQELHSEILERYAKLGLAPYSGFINPTLVAVTDNSGVIIDIKVRYNEDFLAQMLDYGKKYSFLGVN